MDCTLPGSSVRGILQARILDWSRFPFPPSGDLPDLGVEAMSLMSPALEGGFFTPSATWEAQKRYRKVQKTSHCTFWHICFKFFDPEL